MATNRGKDLAFNAIIIGVGKFSTQIISFLLLPLYTSILTTSEYGIYDLVITLSSFLLPVITLLLEESMFRFLIDCKTEQDKKLVISQTFNYSSRSALIFLSLGIIIGVAFKIPYSILGTIYIFTCILSALRNSLVRGLGMIKFYATINFISSLIILVLNVLFIAVFRFGVNGLLLSGIISNIISTAIVFIKVNFFKYVSIKSTDRKLTKKMIKYSLPLVPNSLSWTIVNLSDRLVISGFMGASANGIYSMSYKFPNLMNTIYSFFYTAWKESSARAMHDDDRDDFFNNIYTLLKKLLFSVSLFIIASMPILFNIFIKEAFNESYLYIPILVIAMYYSNMSGYYGGIFSGYKETKIMGITTMWGAAINLIVNLALIKFIGIYAAAFSTLVSCAIICYYRKIKVRKYIDLKEKNLYAGIVLLGITLLLYYLNTNIIFKLLNLLLVFIYCFILNYGIFSKFFKRFKKQS